MNRYLKQYIRNRQILLDTNFYEAPLETFELKYFNFKNLSYFRLIDRFTEFLNKDINTISILLENKTFFLFDSYFYADIVKKNNDPMAVINRLFKDDNFKNLINNSDDFRLVSFFYSLNDMPELMDNAIDSMLDNIDNIDINIITNQLPYDYYDKSENINKILKRENIFYDIAKNYENIIFSTFYRSLSDKQRLFFFYGLLKYTDLYFSINNEELYELIFLREYDFEDNNVKKSYLLLFLKNEKIKNALGDQYYSRILRKYEQIS